MNVSQAGADGRREGVESGVCLLSNRRRANSQGGEKRQPRAAQTWHRRRYICRTQVCVCGGEGGGWGGGVLVWMIVVGKSLESLVQMATGQSDVSVTVFCFYTD